jgi:thiamine biosynthesis lipoprotein
MATPCEVRIETDNMEAARRVGLKVESEALRIEKRFSRYLADSEVGKINHSGGREVIVDSETAFLLQYAAECFELSDGLFDITSGVLRRAWKFDGSNNLPDPSAIAAIRPLVGWHKVLWWPPRLTLPLGMEIDLGGIAKEFAVDNVARLTCSFRSVVRINNIIKIARQLKPPGWLVAGWRGIIQTRY